ncbi:hypothetical protein HHK36_006159 [Tetracentron sinense]|uniref:Uncharacterized protein n=1 Tax=Tetracentron sinense TaxID=13715 RepID=A0A834ZGX7_TETSI|nr:hypothetical protein HHK36_006159 [Tetracentron sinense]
MNSGPKLQEEKSCCCVAMDIGNWCNSGSRSIRLGRNYLESNYDEFVSFNSQASRSSTPRWRVLWRRIKKEKKKIFDSPVPVQVQYDPYTYSQNFDQGSASAELDNVSRSFSARFADPSRIFQRNERNWPTLTELSPQIRWGLLHSPSYEIMVMQLSDMEHGLVLKALALVRGKNGHSMNVSSSVLKELTLVRGKNGHNMNVSFSILKALAPVRGKNGHSMNVSSSVLKELEPVRGKNGHSMNVSSLTNMIYPIGTLYLKGASMANRIKCIVI